MLQNATQAPRLFYGQHFVEGVAEYRYPKQEPFRVLVHENAARKMDATFTGKPLVVLHTNDDFDEILPDIQNRADGYVVRSFFNPSDGKHWAEFLVVSDRAHKAIADGWTLSNCYKITKKNPGALWNGVDYRYEVADGEYEHLALVPDPRYESKVFTPEQFKAYNSQKELELTRLANAKGDSMSIFNFRKKPKAPEAEKIANTADLEEAIVTLPGSKAEISVKDALTELDAIKVANAKGGKRANGDEVVKVDDEEMTVNELSEKYKNAKKKNADEDEAAKKKADDEKQANEAKKEEEEKKANALKLENERLANAKKEADDAAAKDKAAGLAHFESLKNAGNKPEDQEMPEPIDLGANQAARGAKRYGSAK